MRWYLNNGQRTRNAMKDVHNLFDAAWEHSPQCNKENIVVAIVGENVLLGNSLLLFAGQFSMADAFS